VAAALLVWGGAVDGVAFAAGDVARGQKLFQACAACHSLEPDKHMTGPSLSGLLSRRAGSVSSFARYSTALKSSGVVWDDKSLDAWLADPQSFVPGNTMAFPGVKDGRSRADLIAFLAQATRPGARPAPQSAAMGGMAGMGGGAMPNLKKAGPETRVQSIAYCGDTYEIATADGKKRRIWERNLRFKTDSSVDGPADGAPALTPAGMMGDRADVIFSQPAEIGQFVKQTCPLDSD
jgi:cytochrome c